ncbi:MAG: hypothetical protein ACP5JD_05485 [Candidatus Bipolaricaulaceae bacterium]
MRIFAFGRLIGFLAFESPGAWEKLQRALCVHIDREAFEKMRGTVSFPFQAGEHGRIAVKVIDFRGDEVVRVVTMPHDR